MAMRALMSRQKAVACNWLAVVIAAATARHRCVSGLGPSSAPSFHFGVGSGLRPGGMGDPQLYWDEPTHRFHIQPQYSPAAAVAPANVTACKPHGADGWGHATSSDLIGDFQELPSTFGACSCSELDMYSSAGTGCTLRINATHVGSLVNGDTTTGWETTNNYAAVVNSASDPVLKAWTQISHGIEGNHGVGEKGWIGTPGNHIPAPFGLIGNVVAYHNSTASNMAAIVSSSVGNPRLASSLPAFLVYTSNDFASWAYSHPLYTHATAMNRAECGDFFPIGPGTDGITAANVDFGKAARSAAWVLMWSRPARNGGGQSRSAGVVYLVGRLERNGSFTPTSPLQAADYGSGFYASQTVLGPGNERIIMADLGGGIQSLPRAVTLNQEHQALNFQPVAALAEHHVGAPYTAEWIARGAAGAGPLRKPLPGLPAGAVDICVTVHAGAAAATGAGAGAAEAEAEVNGHPGIELQNGLAILIDFTTSFPTGNGRSMRTLNIMRQRALLATIAVVDTFRVVVDQDIIEIFGGATPFSLRWQSSAADASTLGTAALLVMPGANGTSIGPWMLNVTANAVAPAKITPAIAATPSLRAS